jgi:hypothetical protein
MAVGGPAIRLYKKLKMTAHGAADSPVLSTKN